MMRIATFLLIALTVVGRADGASGIELNRDDASGQLHILIDGQEAFVYQFGEKNDMTHYFPLRSPSGRSMTVQKTDPYPHHRSFWFGDKVQLKGQRAVSFYAALYSQKDKKDPNSPFVDQIRHVKFEKLEASGAQGVVDAQLIWEMDSGKTPVLDESRLLSVKALGKGEYFLDITFTLSATYDDVEFLSDWVHYAWPFLRMNKQFNVQDGGGTITNSEGGVNQAQTNGKPAHWVDYSTMVEGKTEGLAVFSHPSNGYPHKWLTRDYGTFGPRRVDAQSGKKFTLKKGDSLQQRVGIFVHCGDVTAAKVATRFEQYVAGEL
jgi:hypothetical protein